jgi:molybdopterin molybdotransferase
MPAPLSVDEALARILDGVAPTPVEAVAIEAAHRRTLAEPLAALITQPPFDASAMDGYAVRAADVARLPATLALIGEAAAGHPFAGTVAVGQAVRIFTGAPLPAGADAVVIQENATQEKSGHGGATVIVREGTPDHGHVRHTGFDFRAGEVLLQAGRRLGPREVALAAAMGHGRVPVRRPPRVAVISTGDELVAPGARPGCWASLETRARAWRRISRRRKARTSSSPSAARRSATMTSSGRCWRRAAWRCPSGGSPCAPASR